jgi:hypothetical protein
MTNQVRAEAPMYVFHSPSFLDLKLGQYRTVQDRANRSSGDTGTAEKWKFWEKSGGTSRTVRGDKSLLNLRRISPFRLNAVDLSESGRRARRRQPP